MKATQWQLGAQAMVRSFKCVLQLMQKGMWSMDEAIRWCDAVLSPDKKLVESIRKDFETQLANKNTK